MSKNRHSVLLPAIALSFMLIVVLLSTVFIVGAESMIVLFLVLFGILLVLSIVMYFLFKIYIPIRILDKKMKSLSVGEMEDVTITNAFKELQQTEKHLRSHLLRMKEVVEMANSLAEGETEIDFQMLSEKDEVGQALIKLRSSILKSNKEVLRRQAEDEQQNWSAQGLAKFGDLVRNFESDVNVLAAEFMKELTAYLDMEVGGFFVYSEVENNSPLYILAGSWAFDRNKMQQMSFAPGEGLVGRCVLEKQSIVITDIPKEYIKIRSGMGEDYPSTLILIPVLFDTQVLAVIELATFSDVPEFKIEFLEILGLRIAAGLGKALKVV